MKTFVAICLMLAASSAVAQEVDPNSDLGQFRSQRAAGMAALDGGDVAGATKAFATASAILPDSPSVILLRAQLALKQRRKADARALLADYLSRGYVIDLARNPDFNAVWDSDLENLLQENESRVGDMQVAATLDGFTLTEAMTYASDSGQLFLSHIRTGQITVQSPNGSREVITFRPGVAAYGLGLRDNHIWATTAATRQTKSFDPKLNIVSKVAVIDPANGQVVQTFSDTADRRFGHLLMGQDDLYVADTTHGEILRLNGYQGQLQVLIPEGYFDSPTAMAESEDGQVLIVADFISGLYRVDLAEGSMQRLPAPAGGSTLGYAALVRHGNDLIAIQNGFKPNRIVRLHMSEGWTEIQSVDTLLRSEKLLSQPGQGQVDGDRFVFVARSQWDNMDEHSQPVSDTPEPAVIGAINLQP